MARAQYYSTKNFKTPKYIPLDKAIRIACGKDKINEVKQILNSYDTDFEDTEIRGTAYFRGYSELCAATK